jgi:short-subunit dehydrogenase
MYSLEGKVVAITGASRGIGRALAHAYGKRGAKVALLARDAQALTEVSRELTATGVTACAFRCDVSSDGECRVAVAAVRARFGRIDVLVSNAGITLLSPVASLSLQTLREVIEVNLLGPLRLIQLVLPEMQERGEGQIVVVSSVAAMRALPGLGGYSATKAGLHALTDALRVELEGSGIDVIAVAPGKTTTDILKSARGAGGGRRPLVKLQPSMTADYVAAQIARASERRTRRVTLGLGAHLIELVQRLSPAMTDRLAARTMTR